MRCRTLGPCLLVSPCCCVASGPPHHLSEQPGHLPCSPASERNRRDGWGEALWPWGPAPDIQRLYVQTRPPQTHRCCPPHLHPVLNAWGRWGGTSTFPSVHFPQAVASGQPAYTLLRCQGGLALNDRL